MYKHHQSNWSLNSTTRIISITVFKNGGMVSFTIITGTEREFQAEMLHLTNTPQTKNIEEGLYKGINGTNVVVNSIN